MRTAVDGRRGIHFWTGGPDIHNSITKLERAASFLQIAISVTFVYGELSAVGILDALLVAVLSNGSPSDCFKTFSAFTTCQAITIAEFDSEWEDPLALSV